MASDDSTKSSKAQNTRNPQRWLNYLSKKSTHASFNLVTAAPKSRHFH